MQTKKVSKADNASKVNRPQFVVFEWKEEGSPRRSHSAFKGKVRALGAPSSCPRVFVAFLTPQRLPAQSCEL